MSIWLGGASVCGAKVAAQVSAAQKSRRKCLRRKFRFGWAAQVSRRKCLRRKCPRRKCRATPVRAHHRRTLDDGTVTLILTSDTCRPLRMLRTKQNSVSFFFLRLGLSVVCSSAVLPAQTVAVVDRFAGGAGNSANGFHLFDVRAGNQRHAELKKNEYTKFYNSITKDFDMPFGHLRFSENAMPKSILYVPKTLVAHPFQNQDLAFSSGTMKFSGEGKKFGCSETDKKKVLVGIWRFKNCMKVDGRIVKNQTQWLKTWIVIKIPEENHFVTTVTPLAESFEPHHSDAEFAIYSKTRGTSFLEAGDVVLVTV
ncbi:hypothetical protein niasHS_012018 [Heterodera schachtii]|uniref:Uncharacterized protein n=1 Tax=Heterodera schachtii TaxID=97005 RepID=A0ABD2IGX6_HETSC